MSFNAPAPDDDIQVSVDLVPFGLPGRRQNIAFLRVSAIEESSGGGFRVESFGSGNAMSSAMRTARIGPQTATNRLVAGRGRRHEQARMSPCLDLSVRLEMISVDFKLLRVAA
jgi:hypothetical protein